MGVGSWAFSYEQSAVPFRNFEPLATSIVASLVQRAGITS